MLARELKCTRAQLIASMSTAEFEYWKALYRIEAKEREREEKKAKAGRGRRR